MKTSLISVAGLQYRSTEGILRHKHQAGTKASVQIFKTQSGQFVQVVIKRRPGMNIEQMTGLAVLADRITQIFGK